VHCSSAAVQGRVRKHASVLFACGVSSVSFYSRQPVLTAVWSQQFLGRMCMEVKRCFVCCAPDCAKLCAHLSETFVLAQYMTTPCRNSPQHSLSGMWKILDTIYFISRMCAALRHGRIWRIRPTQLTEISTSLPCLLSSCHLSGSIGNALLTNAALPSPKSVSTNDGWWLTFPSLPQ
jgi:hypothetical protein